MNVPETYQQQDPSLSPDAARQLFFANRLQRCIERVKNPALPVEGKLVQMTGLTLVASGCKASIGSRCTIQSPNANSIDAEVVGFTNERLFLMPIGHQANVLVFGPGGYKFFDYTKVGVWLNIIIFIVVAIALPIIWPL